MSNVNKKSESGVLNFGRPFAIVGIKIITKNVTIRDIGSLFALRAVTPKWPPRLLFVDKL